jgi:hypothetical protein
MQASHKKNKPFPFLINFISAIGVVVHPRQSHYAPALCLLRSLLLHYSAITIHRRIILLLATLHSDDDQRTKKHTTTFHQQ